MKLDALEATDAKRSKPVLVLQAAKLTLDGGASPTESVAQAGRFVYFAKPS